LGRLASNYKAAFDVLKKPGTTATDYARALQRLHYAQGHKSAEDYITGPDSVPEIHAGVIKDFIGILNDFVKSNESYYKYLTRQSGSGGSKSRLDEIKEDLALYQEAKTAESEFYRQNSESIDNIIKDYESQIRDYESWVKQYELIKNEYLPRLEAQSKRSVAETY
jgi:hypothetical protein